jgi:uncharacterized repeat protein (TIGR01451 family)
VIGRLYAGSGSTPQEVAGQVAGLTNIIAIAAGWEHTIALKGDGTVWACGRNLEGQLGDGTTNGSTFPPPTAKFFVQVVDPTDPTGYLTGVTGVGADGRHSVAVKSNGTSWAWGWNNGGQLCDGTLINKITPAKMKDPLDASGFMTGVERAGAGDYHTLLVKRDGTAWGCGWNYSGQLGTGTYDSPKLTPVKALIPEYSLLYAWGSGYVTPGEEATFLIEYHNITTETLQDAVVIFHIPGGFNYDASSNGGIYRDDRNQAFWKLGNLPPGAKGLLTLKIEVPWGLPLHQDITMFVDLAARNISSSTEVDDYLNYIPVQVMAEIPYTAGDIDALLSSDLKLKELLDYALSLGYLFDQVALRYDLSDGSSSLFLALLNPGQSGPVFLKEVGETLFLEKYEDAAYSLFDKNGGFRVDSNDGSFKSWGTWAVAHSQSEDRCTSNCLVQNPIWNRYISTKTFKQTSKSCIACQQALTAKKTDPTNCANCARLYLSINGKNHPMFAKNLGKCIGDCKSNSNKWQCQSGETLTFCGYGIVDYAFVHNNPPLVFHLGCKIEGGGSRWEDVKHEFCEAHQICIDTPSPHCAAPCELEDQKNQTVSGALSAPVCEPCLRSVPVKTSVSKDPNAKSVDFKGNVIPEQQLTYTIDYENIGDGTAYGVFILDELDSNLNEATLSIKNGGTYSSGSRLLGWDVGTLASKGKGSVSFSVKVKSGLSSGTEITNVAKVYFPSANEITPTNPVANRVQSLAADPKTVETTSTAATPIILSGRDSGSKALTYRIARPPSFGTITGTPPNITYTSMGNFSGPDEFYYVVNNGLIDSDPARVLLKVNPSLSDVNSPTVVGTYPKVNATDVHVVPNPVSTNPSIYQPSFWVTFSEPMDPTTITTSTFTVSGGMTGSVTYDEMTWTAYFVPSKALSPSTTYTAQLAQGIKDKAGNALAGDYSWKFTTESAANIVVILSDNGTELNFGKITSNLLSAEKVVNVLSTGTSDLILGTITKAGVNSGDFKITEDQCSGKTLVQSENCTVKAAFQPSSMETKSSSLSIPSNDPDTPIASVILKGEGNYSMMYLPLILK